MTEAGASSKSRQNHLQALYSNRFPFYIATTAAMNNALRLVRNAPSRTTTSSSSQWACFFCQNARPRTSSSRPNFAELRRKFSSSRPRREQQQQQTQTQTQHQAQQQNATYAPSMDRVREQYSRRNRTIAYDGFFRTAIREH